MRFAAKIHHVLDFKAPSGYDPAYFGGGQRAHLFYQAQLPDSFQPKSLKLKEQAVEG